MEHAEAYTDKHQMSISDYADRLPAHAIRSLIVTDPRMEKEEQVMDIALSTCTGKSGENEAVKDKKHITHTEILDENAVLLSSSEVDSNCEDLLWDAKSGIKPPVEDNVLCKERHDKRMDFFCLGDWDSNTSDTKGTLSCSRSCPVMLLRNNSPDNQFVG